MEAFIDLNLLARHTHLYRHLQLLALIECLHFDILFARQYGCFA